MKIQRELPVHPPAEQIERHRFAFVVDVHHAAAPAGLVGDLRCVEHYTYAGGGLCQLLVLIGHDLH